MIVKEANIKYYDNKETHGMIIDWNKVFKEYHKLKVPEEYDSLGDLPQKIKLIKYLIELSERSVGKTTKWLLIGMIMHLLYGTEIQYIRQSEDMTGPSIADELYNAILSYEDGRYIKDMTGGVYNSIYTHWKKSYFCYIDENGERTKTAEKPFLQFLSLDRNRDYKSTYNAPTGDLILFDEFISDHYPPNEFVKFMDLFKTIQRDRITPIIVMLANTIDYNSMYFKELEISKQIRKLKVGEEEIIETEKGTKILVNILGSKKKATVKERINRLFYGFKNPRLAAITGGEQAWAFDPVPHIINSDDDIIIDRTVKLDCGEVLLQLDLTLTQDRGLIVNCHECTRARKDSIILTNGDINDKQHFFGLGKGQYTKLLWKLYSENKWYYDCNATGSLVDNYVKTFRLVRK